MNYQEISKETIGYLYKSHQSIRKSAADLMLIKLAELYVSQLNGCAYCCSFHSAELREAGMDQSIIDQLPGWKHSDAFDHRQKSVLQWTESITRMHGDFKELRSRMEASFSEKELVDLTASISLMNTLNRLRITLSDTPEKN
ncbi:carboxymuconolactone decarboxylase family protein [Pedobacter lusitanus]|uniref:Carboxymuconolactone decarboxylase family protein n=1 Tax=Pedobacter lusitanus TaxID=1503925 RepID=A0A0D0GJE4_9SPHI|nr:carboxymuconolactone decarboxylase family protein [Pedobacter lusitanus]KIO77342.1 carboxymuconolactone decarboxylase family protein [Pedobacter lusitanus]